VAWKPSRWSSNKEQRFSTRQKQRVAATLSEEFQNLFSFLEQTALDTQDRTQ
jgi:hypothetical protein